MRPRSRRGFTLIELMLAFFLLSVVTYLIYTMLIRGSRSAVSGIWRSSVNTQLQNLDVRVRKALEASSYPSVLSPEMNVVDEDNDAHWVILKQGSQAQGRDLMTSTENGAIADDQDTEANFYVIGPGRKDGSDAGPDGDPTLVLSATACTPGRQRMEGLDPPDQPGRWQRHYFWLADDKPVVRGNFFSGVKNLYYASESGEYDAAGDLDDPSQDIAVGGTPGEGGIPGEGKILVSDVNSVRMRILDSTGAEVDSAGHEENPTIEIVVRCVETTSGTATTGKVIKVSPHVGVRFE